MTRTPLDVIKIWHKKIYIALIIFFVSYFSAGCLPGINEDVKNIIKKLPNAVPEFLRTAKNLTEKEWKDLTEQIKNKKQ